MLFSSIFTKISLAGKKFPIFCNFPWYKKYLCVFQGYVNTFEAYFLGVLINFLCHKKFPLKGKFLFSKISNKLFDFNIASKVALQMEKFPIKGNFYFSFKKVIFCILNIKVLLCFLRLWKHFLKYIFISFNKFPLKGNFYFKRFQTNF